MRSRRWLVPAAMATCAAAAVVAGACSSQAVPSDPVLARGQSIYNDNCAACHGDKGQGGAAPKLANVDQRISVELETKKVANGVSGSRMPAWKDKLSAGDIDAVVRYTRESLGK